MSTVVTPLSWPPWIDIHVIDFTEVRITVSYKGQSHSWIGQRGDVANRETLRVANQVYAGLVQKQQAIDAVTKRLGK